MTIKFGGKIIFFSTWAHLLNTIHRPYFRCKLLYNWIQFTTISASSKSATPKTKLSISLCYQSDVFFRFFWWRRYNKQWSSIIKVVGTAGRDTCRNCNVATVLESGYGLYCDVFNQCRVGLWRNAVKSSCKSVSCQSIWTTEMTLSISFHLSCLFIPRSFRSGPLCIPWIPTVVGLRVNYRPISGGGAYITVNSVLSVWGPARPLSAV